MHDIDRPTHRKIIISARVSSLKIEVAVGAFSPSKRAVRRRFYIFKKARSSNRISVHSWGIAIDVDPVGNPFVADRSKATIPDGLVDVFEKNGFLSLGRLMDRDWGHFELSAEALEDIRASGYQPHPGKCAPL